MQRMPYCVLRISSGIWFVWHKLRALMSYCGKFATILGAKRLILMPKLKQVITTKNVKWGDVLVDTNDVLQCVYSITYKANEWCEGKSKPYNFWCHWSDHHILWIRACMKWTRTPTKCKRSKCKHYLKLLVSGFQNNLHVCFNKFRGKTLVIIYQNRYCREIFKLKIRILLQTTKTLFSN